VELAAVHEAKGALCVAVKKELDALAQRGAALVAMDPDRVSRENLLNLEQAATRLRRDLTATLTLAPFGPFQM
jgi:hypothetical protein